MANIATGIYIVTDDLGMVTGKASVTADSRKSTIRTHVKPVTYKDEPLLENDNAGFLFGHINQRWINQ